MAYTTIDDASAHFHTQLYTGNSSTQSITNNGNSDLQPDLVWTKRLDSGSHQTLVDSSRGTSKQIYANLTNAQGTVSGVTAFNTDGFSLGSNGTANASGGSFVAYQWKANGGTTTSVSASGTGSGCVNACTHQANTTAGFSIITYTGRDDQLNNGQHSLLKHGLGVAPKVFICKRTDTTDDWHYLGGDQALVRQGWYNGFMSLNDADAVNGNHYVSNVQPTATDIYLGNEKVNVASNNYIAYAFAEVQGFSKFSRYVGNGNANGPMVYTGFKPQWLMIKIASGTTAGWYIWDTKRESINPNNKYINVAEADSQGENSIFDVDFLSNGFKLRNSNAGLNGNNYSYVFMAFAGNPFTTSTGVPTTAH